MARTVTGADVTEAIAALARASRSLASGDRLGPSLAGLVEAAAHGTGSEIVAVWLPERDGSLVVRSVWAGSASLAAELDGLRAVTVEEGIENVRGRLEDGAEVLTAPFAAPEGTGVLELVRRGASFDSEETRFAALVADLAGLAARFGEWGLPADGAVSALLDIAGEALAAVADDEGSAARLARLAAVSAGAEAALVWRLRGESLQADGVHGDLEANPALERAARAIMDGHRTTTAGAARAGQLVTLQLGQPALGALQLCFRAGHEPDERHLEQLSSFAVRAAHALRSSERARESGLELERSRALLAVVGEAISRLSLSHTLDTAIERVAELLGSERVAVYLREDGATEVAACRGIAGPHEPVAAALLAAALGSRQGGALVEVADAAADDRLATVREHLEESGIRSALAFALVVGDEPIGVCGTAPTE